MEGSAVLSISICCGRSAALPFVIPTEVEEIWVLSTSICCGPKRDPRLCHPDRSGGIRSSLNQQLLWTEAPPSPLSSRPKWRDLQFSQSSSAVDRSAALPFCHPDRSGGICSSLNQHLLWTEAPPSPLSSRPKWRDLRFSRVVSKMLAFLT